MLLATAVKMLQTFYLKLEFDGINFVTHKENYPVNRAKEEERFI